MFAKPCCAAEKLPRAIMEAPNRVLTFHTRGDVDFEKLYRSIAQFVTDSAVMQLAIPYLNITTANLLLQCFERGWITDLILTTRRNERNLVESTLKPHLAHVSYAMDSLDYYSSQMVLSTSPAVEDTDRRQALILTGPLFAVIKDEKGSLCSYTATYVPKLPEHYTAENGDHLANATLPFAMIHRSKEHIVIPGKSDVIKRILTSVKFTEKI